MRKPTKQDIECAAERAKFCRRQAAKYYAVKKQLRDILTAMDEENLYGELYRHIETAISVAETKGTLYYAEYKRNI